MSTTQESARASTVKLSFPVNSLKNVKNIRIINNDLLIYTDRDNLESVTKTFTDMKFNVVERVYKVHVSTTDKDTFIAAFGNIDYDVSPVSTDNRFIVSITTSSEEEYHRLLSIGNDSTNNCRVRPFRNINVNHSTQRVGRSETNTRSEQRTGRRTNRPQHTRVSQK